jgi:hypothetical protein
VWSTVRLSFYDPTGGSKLGLADTDPKWAAVWREAERRGLKLGAFQSPEGTRQVGHFLISQRVRAE